MELGLWRAWQHCIIGGAVVGDWAMRASGFCYSDFVETQTEGKAMQKLLTTAANHIQASGAVPDSLAAKIRAYDRAHMMWSCMATEEMRDTWQILKSKGLV